MGPIRKSKAKPKHLRKPSTSRLQLITCRSATPTQQRQHIKKQKQKHQQQASADRFADQRARRERWATIAKDTQRIVLGDGKYVEERISLRSVSSVARGDVGSDSPGEITSPSSVYFSSAYAPDPFKGMQEQGTIHVVHDIAPHIQLSKQLSTFYPHSSSFLADWRRRPDARTVPTTITFTPSTTLTATRSLHLLYPSLHTSPANSLPTTHIGVLSFASPRRPGGGYLNGGDEQEEALSRSSSLVASLDTDQAKEFYKTHKSFSGVDGKGIYDHSMVYSPGVVVFRKEDDDTLDRSPPTLLSKSRSRSKTQSTPVPPNKTTIPPYTVNVLSSTPPSYAAIHQTYTITPSTSHIFSSGIRSVLTQRLGRVLRAFEDKGDKAIVLGAYGCGSSEISVEMVAEVWAELLVCGEEGSRPGAESSESREAAGASEPRFKDVFEHVVFAVPGRLFAPFKQAFEMRVLETQINEAARI